MPLPQKKLIPGFLLMLVIAAFAAPPLWWGTGDPPVIDPAAAVNNHGPANIGQAKHMAKSALDALRPVLPAVADQIEADLTEGGSPILDFTVPDPKTPEWLEKQKAPLLIGQLKAIADPFYTRLHAAAPVWLEAERTANGTNHPGSIFPWTAETTDDNNKGIANIGQLKAGFSLRFDTLPPVGPVDSDEDGLPDDWELAHFGSLYEDADGDADGDYLTNIEEFQFGTDPTLPDTDGDGLTDFEEVYWYWVTFYETNPNNWDTDGDGLNDGDEFSVYYTDPTAVDTDSDGLDDGDEVTVYGTDPASADTDSDGLDDGLEIYTYVTSPIVADTDGDGLTDGDEILIHMTDPLNPDSDADGMADGWEITYGLDPNDPADADGDLDNDNLTNLEEFENGSNPTLADTDGDGLNDGDEVKIHGTNPALADSDGDGLSDWEEINTLGTNPLAKDTDGDGISDFYDAAPNENFQDFTDADGDGIPDDIDPDPNTARGAAPVVGSSSGGAGQMANVVAGEELNFQVQVSNPAGEAPTASQIKFFLDGTETAATVTHLGGRNFVIKWISTLHADYPEMIVQLATAKFTDSEGAVAWKNLASVDVAEWEGDVSTAPVRQSSEDVSQFLEVETHLDGKRETKYFGGALYNGSTTYYRGPSLIEVIDGNSENTVVNLQIPSGAKWPIFLIKSPGVGIDLVDTVEGGDYLNFPHNALAFYNNHPNQPIQFNWGGIQTDFPTGTTTIQDYGDLTGYQLNNIYYKSEQEWQVIGDYSWWIGGPFSDTVYHHIGSGYDSGGILPHVYTIRVNSKLPATITPHLAGTDEVPGLPIHPLSIERENTPFIVGSETFHHVVFRVDPAVEDYTNGVKLRLRRTGENYEHLPPQPGIHLFQTAYGEPLPLDANGDITLSPTENNELFQNLISDYGLTLLLTREATADEFHKIQIVFLSKYEEGKETVAESVDVLPINVEFVETETGELADVLRSSNVAPGIELNTISLADVTVDAEAGEAVVEISGTVDDFLEDLIGETRIDTIHCSTGQTFAVVEGAFSGTLRVPLGTADVRVELETGESAAGRKGMVAFTLLTDFVPVPPPVIDPTMSEPQYDGFTVELGGFFDPSAADSLDVLVKGPEGVNFPPVLNEGAADTVVADVFGKRLSLAEDGDASLRFVALDAALGEVVVQFLAADFVGGELPPKAVAQISAQNVFGGVSLPYRFLAYKAGHTSYQGFRVLSLDETTANSLVFRAVTPDYGTVEFAVDALSGYNPQLFDTMDGTLSWTLPVSGNSQGELVESLVDSGVFVPAIQTESATIEQGVEDSMLIVSGVESDGAFYGGKETIYRMRVSKIGDGTGQTHVTFTDPDTGETRDMALEEDEEADWLSTKDFAVLDVDPATAPESEQLLLGQSTQVVWTVQAGENASVEGTTNKMVTRIRPNPGMDDDVEYEWEEGKFFAGPFWVWGEDLVFDAGPDGQRDFLKEGDADSEGIIEVKLANNFDTITVEVFPATKNAEGKLVPDGEALYVGNYDHPDKVKFDKLQKGRNRFWDGRVNRLKGGEKAASNYEEVEFDFSSEDFTVFAGEVEYYIETWDQETDNVKVRKKDDGKEVNTTLGNINKNEANIGKVEAWQAAKDAAEASHDWIEKGRSNADAHPYFLDPDFGPCLVKVTGKYTEDGKEEPIVEVDDQMVVQTYSKKLIAYVGRDQAFDEEARQTNQLATDILCYELGGLVKPSFIGGKYQDNGGEIVTSRHITQSKERTTAYPATVVDLDRDSLSFHNLFKRQTQRGTLVIHTHGSNNLIRLENTIYLGFKVKNNPTVQDLTVSPYPLSQLELNTATVYLNSCHSGTVENGKSLATNVYDILNTGVQDQGRKNKVIGFDGVSISEAAPYSYRSRFNISPKNMTPEEYKLNAGLVDEWLIIIQNSGVDAPDPISSYEPYNGDESVKISELWSVQIVGDEVTSGPIPVERYGTNDFWYELNVPEGDPIVPVDLDIWEVKKNSIGMNVGIEKKNVSYSGLSFTTIPHENGIQIPVATITGTTIDDPENNLTANVDHFFVLRKPDRGGHNYFRRYSLQIEMEQGQMPGEDGTPGGDRMKHLRTQFEGITVNDTNAKEFSKLIYNLRGTKLGEGGNAVEVSD